MPQFSKTEEYIKNLFVPSEQIRFNNKLYNIGFIDKPSSSSGEPKTDLYVLIENEVESIEIKISIKQGNADFIENKIKAERAAEYFGNNWKEIVMASTFSIKSGFERKFLIYKQKHGRTQKGCITLGWKFEFLNKSGGELSGEIEADLEEAYKGISLEDDKKNAIVNGKRINNSGVAEYLLFVKNISSFTCAQDVIDKVISIDKYISERPKLYFACKALNYRTMVTPAKWDGDRPLAVFVDWSIENGKLKHQIRYDAPLVTKGNAVAIKLQKALEVINISNTDQLNSSNVLDCSICKS